MKNIPKRSIGPRLLRVAMAPLLCAITLVPGLPADGQPTGYVVTVAPDSPERSAQLARDVTRTQSLRTVRNLEVVYSQYAQAGLWDEMGSLFTDTAEIVVDGKLVARGGAAMAKRLKSQFNGGKEGLPRGAMHALLMFQPVVTLSFGGNGAAARWSEYEFNADGRGGASLRTGKKLDQYVRENGVWKISRMEYFTEGAGSYDEGIHAVGPYLPQIPYGYTPASAGRPVPDEPSGADKNIAKGQSLAETERQIDRLNDEDLVNNLQNKYGYYIDRKMWSDVTDLFVKNGVLEIAGRGFWSGGPSIRRALEVDGPEGLQKGQVNDHMQFPAIVTIDANGMEARARGLEFGVLTPKLGEAYWSMAVFDNRFVKQDGVWHIAEMHLYPAMKSDYYQGWGKSNIVDPVAGTPDKPSSLPSPQNSGAIVAFFTPNPVTGKPVAYPAGAVVAQSERSLPAANISSIDESRATVVDRLEDARRKLNISRGYDAANNVSSSFGYYLDDADWDDMASSFAVDGTRPQGPGFYVGPDHIYRAMTQAHYRGTTAPNDSRPYVTLHTRMQPVIDVSNDGRFAKIRSRMFLTRVGTKIPTGFNSGMYPNETAVLENGVWKMQVGGEIDETYYASGVWKDGWAKPRPAPTAAPGSRRPWQPGDAEPITDITNTIDFPPDIPRAWFENFRLKDMESTNYPDIKPMWFAYRNPVSGRFPLNYCPEFLKCSGY